MLLLVGTHFSSNNTGQLYVNNGAYLHAALRLVAFVREALQRLPERFDVRLLAETGVPSMLTISVI